MVQDSGSAVGTAATVNFADNLTVTFGAGISTVTGIGTENIRTNTNATFLQNVNVSGTTTVAGNINANGNIVGDNSTDISGINDITASSLAVSDSISHDGDTNTKIRFPEADKFTVETSGSERFAVEPGGNIYIHQNVNVAGVVTAASFSGDGSSLTGTGNTSNVRTGILDVAGIATFRSDVLVGSGITLSPEGDGYYTGVITATKYEGDGSALTGIGTANVRTGILDVAGIATFRSDTLVGSGITLSPDGNAFHTGVVTATSFVGDGTNLTGVANTGQILSETLTVSIGATIGIASFSSSGIVTTTDAVGIVTYYGDVSNAAHQRWYLGANGTDDYTFVGNGCTITRHDPTLFLARGGVYEFVNNMGAHPFRIQMAYQNTSGQVFPHGVTNNAVSAGTLRFEVPLDAPNTLYYQCTSHAGMSGTITVYPSL